MRTIDRRNRVPALLLFTVFLGVVAPRAVCAQRDTVAASSADTVGAAPGAPVVVGPDTLFRLYGNLGPFSAQARAATASAQLIKVAPRLVGGDSLVVSDLGTYSELRVDSVVVMTVVDADANPLNTDRQSLARRYAAQMRAAVVVAAERVSVKAILMDVTFAVLVTAALLVLLWLMAVGFPKLYVRLEELRRVTLPAVKIQNFEVLSAGRLSALLIGTARVVRILLTLLLFYVYVPLVLSFFPWTAPLSQRIVGYALHPFSVAWFAFVRYVPNLFYLAAGVIILRYVLRLLRALSGALETGSITFRGFYPEWADPTYKIVRVLVFAFAAIVLYPYLPGANSDAFKGVSIFVGVLFSFGSSGAIGNMVAGVVLTYTRAFQLGDRVKIGDTVGDVTEKTLLVTRVRTIKNVAVTIPNGAVLSSQVVNYTTLAGSRGLILHTSVTIGYNTPWKSVHAALLDAASRTEHIVAEPAPFVWQTSLDDFYVSYEINAATDRADLMAGTYAELHRHIQDSFYEAGLEILSPHWAQLRDGNRVGIPESYLPRDYRAPVFRVETIPGKLDDGGAPARRPANAPPRPNEGGSPTADTAG
jgi:small-conductance mechanosensitive channel